MIENQDRLMVTERLPAKAVKIPLESADKASVIAELVGHLCDTYSLANVDRILDLVLAREEMMSTGVGYGIAIPHAKIDDISSAKLVAGTSPVGVDFDSIDRRPARIFFLLVSPKNDSAEHVMILSKLSRILNNSAVREALLATGNGADFVATLKRFEER